MRRSPASSLIRQHARPTLEAGRLCDLRVVLWQKRMLWQRLKAWHNSHIIPAVYMHFKQRVDASIACRLQCRARVGMWRECISQDATRYMPSSSLVHAHNGAPSLKWREPEWSTRSQRVGCGCIVIAFHGDPCCLRTSGDTQIYIGSPFALSDLVPPL